MAFRQSGGYRVLLMVLSLACLGAVGYFVWQLTKQAPSLEETFKQAENTYKQGEDAYNSGQYSQAVERFDATRKQTEQVLGSIAKLREQAKAAGKEVANAEQINKLDGNAHYLRARAIRDKHFAQAAAEGKKFEDTPDTSTGEKYRNMMRIADTKEREEAGQSLFEAARILNKDADVLKEAVRLELSIPFLDWERLSRNLNAMLEIDPKDSRAHYWLARYDFLQPQRKNERVWVDSDPSRRSVERVERSLRAVRKAKDLGTQPPWRLFELEALALEWLAEHNTNRKPNQPNKPEDELRVLLLHPSSGAIATLNKADTLDLPHARDLQGVITAYLAAVRLTVRDAARPQGDRKPVVNVLRDFLVAAPKIRNSVAGKTLPVEISYGLLEAIAAAQKSITAANTSEWPELFDKYVAAVAETKAQNVTRPAMNTLLKDVFAAEINRSGGTDADREARLKKQQAEMIDASLKEADKNKLSRAELDELHTRALEFKLLNGTPIDDLKPHLEALKPEPGAHRPPIASYAEGLIAWRQGELLRAREHFETTLRFRDSVRFQFGSQWLLYQIYTATGQTAAGLNSLNDSKSYFEKPEKFTALDRLALAESPIDPADFVAHLAVANIDVTRQRIARHLRENPETPIPEELWATTEKTVDATLKKLKTPSAADLYLRLAYYRLRLAEQRREQADEGIRALKRDYPDSVAVLAAEVGGLALPRNLSTDTPKPSPEGIKEADTRLEEFCTSNPRNIPAKLLRVEWLARTGRIEEAVAMVRDPVNFTPAIGNEVALSLAHLRGYPHNSIAAREVLDYQPPASDLVTTLIQAIAEQNRPAEALVDPFRLGEARGRQSIRKALRLLSEGEFEQAAGRLMESISIAALAPAVRDGVWQTVRSCAAVDPVRSRKLCIALASQQPDEPVLYLGAAFSALLMGDFGQTRESWERSKSMAAALNMWELTSKKWAFPADLAMMRSHFWTAAGRPAAARDEAARALTYDDTHVDALVFHARLALADNSEGSLKTAQQHWNTAVAVDPDDIDVRCLEAEIKAQRGDLPGAIRTAQDLVKDAPQQGRAHACLVRIGAKKKDGDEVGAWIAQWIKAVPCDILAGQLAVQMLVGRDKVPEAGTAADAYLAGCSTAITRQLDELKPGQPGAALDNWQRNSTEVANRTNGEAWRSIIAAFKQAGQPEAAAARLQTALQKNPDSEVLLLLKAELDIAAERWKDAQAAYRRILARNPRHIKAVIAAIRLTPKAMDPDATHAVIKAFGSAGDLDATLDPNLFPLDVLMAIGEVHEQFTKNNHRSDLRKVLAGSLPRFPNDARLQVYCGQLHYVMGDGMRAKECAQRALRLAKSEDLTDLSSEERQMIFQMVQQLEDKMRDDPKVGNSDA